MNYELSPKKRKIKSKESQNRQSDKENFCVLFGRGCISVLLWKRKKEFKDHQKIIKKDAFK